MNPESFSQACLSQGEEGEGENLREIELKKVIKSSGLTAFANRRYSLLPST